MNNQSNTAMKKVKVLCYIATVFLLTACAQQNYLQKTVWLNAVETRASATPASIITSLEFLSDTDVDIYHAVVDDNGIAVKAFKYATGKYKISGNPKVQADINIKATNINNESLNYHGIFRKNKAIILMDDNSTVRVYGKSKIKIP